MVNCGRPSRSQPMISNTVVLGWMSATRFVLRGNYKYSIVWKHHKKSMTSSRRSCSRISTVLTLMEQQLAYQRWNKYLKCLFMFLKIRTSLSKKIIVRNIPITEINKRGGWKLIMPKTKERKKKRVMMEDDLVAGIWVLHLLRNGTEYFYILLGLYCYLL